MRDNLGPLAIAAVRYAVTRNSTAAGTIIPGVQRAWESISVGDRKIIRRDVEEAIRDDERCDGRWYGDIRQEWVEFADWLAERTEVAA